jgi:tetratricopeptide (TPR) repeat protein
MNLPAVLVLMALLFFNIPPVYAETALEYLDSGNDSLRRGALDQAIYEYTQAIEIDPGLAKAYDNRGVTYAQEGSLPRAIADFTMAIANDPKDAEAYNNRGHAYAKESNLIQASFDYSKAIEINPFYLKAYKNRVQLDYDLKEYDKAWSDMFKVEELGGSNDPQLYEQLKKASGKSIARGVN